MIHYIPPENFGHLKFIHTAMWWDGPVLFIGKIGSQHFLGLQGANDKYCLSALTPKQVENVMNHKTTVREAQRYVARFTLISEDLCVFRYWNEEDEWETYAMRRRIRYNSPFSKPRHSHREFKKGPTR
jgi:hypothetical protein